MNKLTILGIVLLGAPLLAQVPDAPPPPPPEPAPAIAYIYTADQLEQLVGPIALYPDPLIALILPAATDAPDVVLAARYLQSGGDPNSIDAQPWDDSVKGLTHFPQVILWMDQNLVWTKQLGEAFAAQPADVMNAVQRLRARARAAGTLGDLPQQRVIYASDGTIEIVPSDPEIIYVPYYDPSIVYAPRYVGLYPPSAYFGFSSGFSTGWWLCFGFDWHERRVWSIDRDDRERFWREHRKDWNRRMEPPPGRRPPAAIHDWRPSRHPETNQPRPGPSRPPQFPSRVPRDQDRGPRTDNNRRENAAPNSNHDAHSGGPNPATGSRSTPGLRPPLPQPLGDVHAAPSPQQNVSRSEVRPARENRGAEARAPAPASPPPRPNFIPPVNYGTTAPAPASAPASPAPRAGRETAAPAAPVTNSAPPRYTPPPAAAPQYRPPPQSSPPPRSAPAPEQAPARDDDSRRNSQSGPRPGPNPN